jgi:hypothetical protein
MFTRLKQLLTPIPAGSTLQTSAVDGNSYIVIDDKVSGEAADTLARVRIQLNNLIRHVVQGRNDENYQRYSAGIDTMIRRLRETGGLNLVELDYRTSDAIAINSNKNEQIAICMRRNPPYDNTVADDTIILYIAIHELAHSMLSQFASSFGGHTVHSREFRDHEAFLLRTAETMGMLRPADIPGRTHCRLQMPDPANAI